MRPPERRAHSATAMDATRMAFCPGSIACTSFHQATRPRDSKTLTVEEDAKPFPVWEEIAATFHSLRGSEPNSIRIALVAEPQPSTDLCSTFALASNGDWANGWRHAYIVDSALQTMPYPLSHLARPWASFFKWGSTGSFDWLCWLPAGSVIVEATHDWVHHAVAQADEEAETDQMKDPVHMVVSPSLRDALSGEGVVLLKVSQASSDFLESLLKLLLSKPDLAPTEVADSLAAIRPDAHKGGDGQLGAGEGDAATIVSRFFRRRTREEASIVNRSVVLSRSSERAVKATVLGADVASSNAPWTRDEVADTPTSNRLEPTALCTQSQATLSHFCQQQGPGSGSGSGPPGDGKR